MTAISEKIVAALPVPEAGNRVHFFSGARLQGKIAPSGFGVRVTCAGTRSFIWFHRVDGKKHLETIGPWDRNEGGGKLSTYDAIVAAIARAKAVHKGVDKKGVDVDVRPERTRRLEDGDKPAALNVAGLLDQYLELSVKPAKLRTADEIERGFERLVKPAIGKLGIYEIKRSHVMNMLDAIADENGPVMSDRILSTARAAFIWYAKRDDDFAPPIIDGMARCSTKERARRRVLDDAEIRDLFAALASVTDVPACYPAYIKTVLFTASRRNEASEMHARELDGNVWTVPASRYKTGRINGDHTVPLSDAALAAIGEVKKGRFVFSSDGGKTPFSGFSKSKAALDREIAAIRKTAGREPMKQWGLHDLRRTARTLMSRAKIPTDDAERAIGHVIGGVRETYDRWEYHNEKKAAFAALASLINRILNPVPSNVVEMVKTA